MDYKIPFWMNTRAETINEHRAQDLEEMNMLRMNVGIEHGNYEYRKKYLKETYQMNFKLEPLKFLQIRNTQLVQ